MQDELFSLVGETEHDMIFGIDYDVAVRPYDFKDNIACAIAFEIDVDL
jgi:hypothetical protein